MVTLHRTAIINVVSLSLALTLAAPLALAQDFAGIAFSKRAGKPAICVAGSRALVSATLNKACLPRLDSVLAKKLKHALPKLRGSKAAAARKKLLTLAARSRACRKRLGFIGVVPSPQWSLCQKADLNADRVVSLIDISLITKLYGKKSASFNLAGPSGINRQDVQVIVECYGAHDVGVNPPGNHAPIANSKTYVTSQNEATSIDLTGTDVDGDQLQFSLLSSPQHGSLTGQAPNLIYAPQQDFTGQDQFQFVVSDGNLTSEPGTITIFVGPWQPPVGIPTPSFGIAEKAPSYDQTNTLHYYVSGPQNCSNSNNQGRGSPSTPLCMIPRTLPAGAYVEVHGGPYDTSPFLPSWTGTAEQPIFIKGIGSPRFNKAFNIYNDAGGGGAYVILDGISFFSLSVGNNYDHLAVRHSDFHGDTDSGGVSLHANTDQVTVHDIVFYNNVIHDNGIWDPNLAQGDRDIHGIGIGWYSKVENVWIVDNDIYHNEGDAIQLNAGPSAPPAYVNHIYIGRNSLHHNKQTGVAVKGSIDVIISQNEIFGHRRSNSAMGPGIGFSDDGPVNAWFMFNRIHDNEIGVKMNGGTGPGPYYIIGNLFYNIHAFTDGTYSANDPYHFGQAVVDWHPAKKYFVNNTIYDSDGGYGLAGWGWGAAQNLTVVNNIFSQLASGAHAVNIEDPSAAGTTVLSNNLFSGQFSMQWGDNRFYTSLESFQNATGQGAACLSGDPGFLNIAGADFRLPSTSIARDTGSNSVIEQLASVFLASYGVDIKKDIDGLTRPQGPAWDIGAYEYNELP